MGDSKKSFFRMGATLLLSLSVVLAGCSGSNSGSGEESSKGSEVGADSPLEISVFLNEAGQQPTADNKIYKKIKEELGVTFK
ncbi:hypothetical protein BK122_12905, partial [Paenibacillus pabuli]